MINKITKLGKNIKLLEVLLLYVLICMKNSTLPKALAVERTQECFKGHFVFFCILHLLEAHILFEYIVMFITGVRVVTLLVISKEITVSFIRECPTDSGCKLTVSICDLKLSLPSHHQTKEDMKKANLDSTKL